MSFDKAMNKMKFDIRLLEYNLSQNLITKEDYQKYLSQLEDCADLVAPTNLDDDSEGSDDSQD